MDACNVNNASSGLSTDVHMWHFRVDAWRLASDAASLLFALPLNVFALQLVLRGRWDRNASDFVPLNQIASEILLSLVSFFHVLLTFLSECFFWRMFVFTSSLYLMARPLAQSFLCLEHYLATVHPVKFLRCKPLRHRLACGCASWLGVVCFSSFGCVFDFKIQFFVIISVFYLCYMLLMTFCCVSVLRALRHPGPGEGHKHQQKGNRTKRRAFKLIVINLINSILPLIPLVLILPLKEEMPAALSDAMISMNIWILILTSFVPAILYLHRARMLPTKYCF